jgi:hypothetical protein
MGQTTLFLLYISSGMVIGTIVGHYVARMKGHHSLFTKTASYTFLGMIMGPVLIALYLLLEYRLMLREQAHTAQETPQDEVET